MDAKLVPKIKQAVLSASESDWAHFFTLLRQTEYEKLRGSGEPSEVQARVKALDHVENVFQALRQNKNETKS